MSQQNGMNLLPAQSALRGPTSEDWIIAGLVPGSQVAGATNPAVSQRQATQTAKDQQFITTRENWSIERIYTTGMQSLNPDAALVTIVDGTPQRYQPLATSVALELNRPASLSNIIKLPSGSTVEFQLVNVTANPSTSAEQVIFHVQVKEEA